MLKSIEWNNIPDTVQIFMVSILSMLFAFSTNECLRREVGLSPIHKRIYSQDERQDLLNHILFNQDSLA